MIRHRLAVALLVLLAWCPACTWATVPPPPVEAVLSIDEPDQAPALRSRVNTGEQVTRLPRHDLPHAAMVRDVPSPAIVLAAQRLVAPARTQLQRRALARRRAAPRDEPS